MPLNCSIASKKASFSSIVDRLTSDDFGLGTGDFLARGVPTFRAFIRVFVTIGLFRNCAYELSNLSGCMLAARFMLGDRVFTIGDATNAFLVSICFKIST